MSELEHDNISRLLQGITIPPQPQILVDLQMEQMQPDCDIAAMAKLISQDAGLSGSILKIINSAAFGMRSQVTSILQGVNLLGINSVINLVNAVSIKGELSDGDIVALGKFWDSSMEVALVASFLAKQIQLDSPDEAYTLGLFHNCGVPLLMKRFEHYLDVLQKAYQTDSDRLVDLENETFKTNHAVIGYYVCKSWKLPDYICRAVHDHHSLDRAFIDKDTATRKHNLIAVLKMAEHICALPHYLGESEADWEWEKHGEMLLFHFGLSDYDFANLQTQVNEQGLGMS